MVNGDNKMNDKYPLALPENTVLAGQYIIQKTLGQGGFGITYKALDRVTGRFVAIKEYFPDSMATRTHGETTVMPFSGDRGDNYAYGKECFLQEAETLAQFIGNDNIVRIYSYFEEYGTAYFVMDFIEGKSLDEYIKQQGGRLSYEETVNILIPVMDALSVVHAKGIVHRDISPDNIFITADGSVKLIDFGAARQSLGDKSQSLDVILKHGFAPKEQYTRRGKQGPFTDIYALGATFYFALTGKKPPDSLERLDEDEIIPPSALGVKLPREAEDAILMSLNVQPADRFQSMEAFKNAMLLERSDIQKAESADVGNSNVAKSISIQENPDNTIATSNQNLLHNSIEISNNTKKSRIPPKALLVGSVVLVVGGMLFFLLFRSINKNKLISSDNSNIADNVHDVVATESKGETPYYRDIPWGTSADSLMDVLGDGYERNNDVASEDSITHDITYCTSIFGYSNSSYLDIENTQGKVYETYICDFCDFSDSGKTWDGLCNVQIDFNDITTSLSAADYNAFLKTIVKKHNELFGEPSISSDDFYRWEAGETVVIMNLFGNGLQRVWITYFSRDFCDR